MRSDLQFSTVSVDPTRSGRIGGRPIRCSICSADRPQSRLIREAPPQSRFAHSPVVFTGLAHDLPPRGTDGIAVPGRLPPHLRRSKTVDPAPQPGAPAFATSAEAGRTATPLGGFGIAPHTASEDMSSAAEVSGATDRVGPVEPAARSGDRGQRIRFHGV